MFGLSLFRASAAQAITPFRTGLLRRLPDSPVGPLPPRAIVPDYAQSRLE